MLATYNGKDRMMERLIGCLGLSSLQIHDAVLDVFVYSWFYACIENADC